MKIGDVDIDYFGHVCFQFQSKQGAVLITDPFFGAGFPWNGHVEKYLTPPVVKAEQIRQCDLIFVSHIHGDHFDPDAVRTIHDRTHCPVLAPRDVLDVLKNLGVKEEALWVTKEGAEYPLKNMTLRTYCGYDQVYTAADGSQNKFSLTISAGSTRLFYSGDCHELPPAVKGLPFDAMLCWPESDDMKLKALCQGIKVRQFILMHGDQFDPGEFLCNLNLPAEKKRLERLVPGLQVIIPERLRDI